MPLIFDLEGNGLLPKLTKIHCLVIHDTKTGVSHRFRNNDVENNIEEGLRLLMDPDDVIAGHNVIAYDIPAIKKLYPWFDVPRHRVKDTLVLVKVVVPDIKQADMAAWKRGVFPSNRIGSHSLEAWGYRLGKHKGDYAKEMYAKGLDPWESWNPEMEDYCCLDVEVTLDLWNQIQSTELHPDCDYLEHDIHTVCAEMERNGFPFDKEAALSLKSQLETERNRLFDAVVSEIGVRLRPVKKKVVKPLFYDAGGVQLRKEMAGLFPKPDVVNGESYDRKWWGDITVPKKKYTRNGVTYDPECPYVKCEFKEFNPGSRTQIVDFLVEDYDWKPTEFTEGGSPSVDAATLEKLSADIPVCGTLAELFFYDKLLGQLANGPQNWITACGDDGVIHAHIDTGGTVTGRCTHSKPNLGQVPGVVAIKVRDKEGNPNPTFLGPNGNFLPHCYDFNGKLKKEGPLLGRKGDFGWECRSLFRVPDKWVQVGVDLSGIEFRALAHLTAEFDGGELVEVVLNGDIHAFNQQKTGIPTRDIVKRILYGLLYGAGDYKLGITADPLLNASAAKAYGARLRAQLMEGLPALDKAIKKVQQDAKRGYIVGLDGRLIKVRSEHSALNTRLQSDAAIIAKRWVCLTRHMAGDTGALCGWNDGAGSLGDFVMMTFVHDEIQMAAAPAFAEELAKICIDAARIAGEEFEYRCPVGAEAKLGYSWAQCH